MEHWLGCLVACGIFPDRGSKPCLLHGQVDSLSLRPLEKLHFDLKLLGCSRIVEFVSAGRWGPTGPVPALVLDRDSRKPPSKSAGTQLCGMEQVEWVEAEVGAAVVEVDPPRLQRQQQLKSRRHYYKELKPTLAASLTTSATSSMAHGYSNICITLLFFAKLF